MQGIREKNRYIEVLLYREFCYIEFLLLTFEDLLYRVFEKERKKKFHCIISRNM